MQIRKLLICTEPRNEMEAGLKKVYLNRVQEMFKRALNLESIFNIFDEVFHGLSQVSLVSENLYSFYESLLTITSYYQHSQAGRGSLIAKLLEDLGSTGKMEFEFSLMKLPKLLGQNIELGESELTKQKFDIVNKIDNNLAFCELKMKVYSGCTAGRIEVMEKFKKFIELIIGDQTFRGCIKNSGIKNIFLIGGILFDIQGKPATTQKDKEWGICYNGLMRGKDAIIETLMGKNIPFKVFEEEELRAFSIEFSIDETIKVSIIAVYGDEVIKSLFVGNQKLGIGDFEKQLKEMLYDDLWLGQLIAISERAVLNQYLKKNKNLNNYLISILGNDKILEKVNEFRSNRNEKTPESVTQEIIGMISNNDKNLLEIMPTLTKIGEGYTIEDYIADIVQFLSCEELLEFLLKEINSKRLP